MKRRSVWLMFFFSVSFSSVPVMAQDPAALFKTRCAVCHDAGGEARAPNRDVLGQMSPEQIFTALESGAMSLQGAQLSPQDWRVIAEFLSGKRFGADPLNPVPEAVFCGASGQLFRKTLLGPAWNGWGVTIANTRFQPAEIAGLSSHDLPRLQLKWAFGFPGDSSASAQPVLVGGRVYVGSWGGKVYSLDMKTGCLYWISQAQGAVRSAISVGEVNGGSLVAYFGDSRANVYAVNAATGKLSWKVKVEDHPVAHVTGSPKLYNGRLYVPVSSDEEGTGAAPTYECCKFRGSIVALDAANGKQLWKTYTIAKEPRPTRKNQAGTQLWGPSGVGVWNSPTVDVKRKLIYVGTGNSYSAPVADTSDAIIALDMESGKLRWIRQLTPNDMWNASCTVRTNDHSNCGDEDSPDFDFAASPILVELKGGRRMLIAAQKSGAVFALDPDRKGEIIWRQRVGHGGTSGGVMWGPAVDSERVYVALSDAVRVGRTAAFDPAQGGGLFALDLRDGSKVWTAPAPPCGDKKPCSPVQAAAVTAIPGVVFSGSADGHLRGYSTSDGTIIWDYDTVREYTTVNGVKAKGGSINNGGPAIVDGMLFTNSGYSHHSGVIPGNVFLAFSVK